MSTENLMNADPAWPVLVRIGGELSSAVLMNRKAYRKSLETGTPWLVHPETGRVLPWPGEPVLDGLEECPGGFRLSLPAAASTEPYGKKHPPEVDPDDRSSMETSVEAEVEKGSGVMAELSAVIAERHRDMPEGSYTTHLFEKGLDKIRKKAGEEAVELLLARDDKDVVYESADLVYHLLVLLEASGLSWSEVTSELARRHSS